MGTLPRKVPQVLLGNYQNVSKVSLCSCIQIHSSSLFRFGIMAGSNAHVMLSGIPANSIDYNNHSDYAELCIGGWKNKHSIIRVGTMEGTLGRISTPFILNNLTSSKTPCQFVSCQFVSISLYCHLP